MDDSKVCPVCNKNKSFDDYKPYKRKHVDGTFVSYLSARCRECINDNRNKKSKEETAKRQAERLLTQERLDPNKKKCNKCEIVKDNTEFRIGKRKVPNSTDIIEYLISHCKECERKYTEKIRIEKNKTKVIVPKVVSTTKVCNLCKIKKDNSMFRIRTELTKKGSECKYLNNNCRECDAKTSIERRIKSPERVRKIYREYSNNKFKTDINFKLSHTFRNRIRELLKKTNTTKTYRMHELLGCSVDFAQEWLEYQFNEGMTWETHGSHWHIDHVIPCSSFDLTDEEEQKRCFNWENIRPLEASINMSKGGKIIEEEIKKHIEKVKEFKEITREALSTKV